MITPFYGELLLQPIPLELSLNYCSHKCAYCFANLNKPDRRAAPKSIVNLLAEMWDRDTLEAQLLQRGYPVMISNKVDPFAASNYRLSLQVMELLRSLKIPVAFQTKGGIGWREALGLIGPSCFYVTITTLDTERAKAVEPGAPPPAERLSMIGELRSLGHHAWVGVNPLVRQWMPDIRGFVKTLSESGVRHIWSEVMHLSKDQIVNLSGRDKAAIGEDVISEAIGRKVPEECFDAEMRLIEACGEFGVRFGCKHYPGPSHVVDPYAEKYPKRFPTMTEWTDFSWDAMKPGDEFTFDEWASYMLERLPDIRLKSLGHYIFSCSRDLGRRIRFTGDITFREVLKTIWVERAHRMNPSRSRAFKKVFTESSGVKVYKLDAEGLPIRYFTGRSLERKEVIV